MPPKKKEETADNNRPVEEVIERLRDADPQVRAQARRELCARAEEAIPKLLEAMQVMPKSVHFEISKTLTEMGKSAHKGMMDAIQHPHPRVRSIAARVLSLIGGQNARKRLEKIAGSEKRKTVRKELREASAKIARRLDSVAVKPAGRSPRESAESPKPKGLSEKEQQEKKLYLNIVRNLILSNWSRPHLSASEAEAEDVLITLKVDRDGSVFRVLIENKWQNSPLGESLKDAVRRSAPFPAVPKAAARGKPEVEITFILPVPSS